MYPFRQNMIVEDDGSWRLQSQREALRSIVPDSLLEIIRAQIDQLAPEDEELLMAASITGRVFAARIIAEALSLEETTVEERLWFAGYSPTVPESGWAVGST
ncbi:MAG TPA: hypothetical protein VLB68_24385 [Pyrinomonadaceae bacterium]|nr:hypothetical protein [Pyrinomonadaceae bacterium]